MTPRVSPVTGSRVWAGAGLVALSVLCGVAGLGELVAPGPWTTVALLLVVSLAALSAVLRRRSRSRLAPTAWTLGAALLALVAIYGGQGTGPGLPVPTLETVRRLSRLASNGATAIVEGYVPLEPTRDVELLIVAGVVATLLVVDLVALGLGRAGLAGVGLVALWTAAALFDRMPGLWVVVLAGTAYLLLLTLTRPTSVGRRWWRDLAPGAAVGATVTVVAVALGPVLTSLPTAGAFALPAGWGGPGIEGPLRLSTDLDMRADLGRRSDRAILRYTTTEESPAPLRMYTMTSFDGREWQRSTGSTDLVPTDGVLWPSADPSPPEQTEVEELAVRVADLDQDRLPIPVEPRAVDVDGGSWRYDADLDEVVSRSSTTRDLSYVVRVTPRDLTEETLRGDRAVGIEQRSPETLEVAGTAHVEDVRRIAQEVTADARTDYDKALALQSYLRDARNFTYDTEVPAARTGDAVFDFLTDRTGYCVQFATSMTVMARLLDLPARLAVGFLPGNASTEVRGEFVVTGQQSHAWPEIYFEDAGWVRFEPTPAIQTGAPPVYADPNAVGPTAAPSDVPTPGASVPASPPATQAAEAPRTTRDDMTIGGRQVHEGVVAGVVGVVLVVLALTTWFLVARRRRRTVRRASRPEHAWAQLRRRLAERGVTWSDATTPRQAGRLVRERYDGEPSARQALERLVSAVETERYTPPRGHDWDPDELEAWVDDVVRPFEVEAEKQRVPTRR